MRTVTYGTVVGTPTLRPADVARLARAYYRADPQLIDESERARRGWAQARAGRTRSPGPS